MVLRTQEALEAFDATMEQFDQTDGFHGFTQVVDLPEGQQAEVWVQSAMTSIYKDWGTGISVDIHSLPEPEEGTDDQRGHFNIAIGSLVVGGPGIEVNAYENYRKPLPFSLTRLAPRLGLWVVDAALQDAQGQKVEAIRDHELQTGPNHLVGPRYLKPPRYQLKELLAAQESLMEIKGQQFEKGEEPTPDWHQQMSEVIDRLDHLYLRYRRPVLHPTLEDITPLIELIENRSAA